MKALRERISFFYTKNELQISLGVFVGGFLFDLITLSEVDDVFSLIQQTLYLLIIGSIICLELRWGDDQQLPFKNSALLRIWSLRKIFLHFILGSLLSLYSIFFFISSSFLTAFAFLIVLFALLILNELERFQNLGYPVRPALFFLCLFGFTSLIVPLALGSLSSITFLLSLFLSVSILAGLYLLIKNSFQRPEQAKKQILLPGATVLGAMTVFYFFGWIPPVPLAIKEIGIYHNIEKQNGNYLLYHEKSWYRFWENGDQDFTAHPGDRIFLYAQIYSPNRFNDSIFIHWQTKDSTGDWKVSDRIPITISGGRKEGFRGFAYKQNYEPGRWRASVETRDGRVIGRIHFHVKKTSEPAPANREFKTELR